LSKIDIKSLTFDDLLNEIKAMGQPTYKAKQISSWLARGVTNFDEMTDQSKLFRAQLEEKFQICNLIVEKRLVSAIDNTVKYLYKLNDGEFVESVVMQYHHGYTICISTQVGCRMGCSFCATGMEGLARNLTPAEMISQITEAERDLKIRISNIVLMGMGEPLDNFDNVLRFLKIVSSPDSLNIGMRHISISTCGVVNKIDDLAAENLQLTLSVSLHAPSDEIRSRMMPINKRWGIDELLSACKRYTKATGRRISFEYAMVDGVNDSRENAVQLASKLKGMLCHVNLIPVNPVDGTGYRESRAERIKSFIDILGHSGITATVRRTLGSDINASCGQLRRGVKKGGDA